MRLELTNTADDVLPLKVVLPLRICLDMLDLTNVTVAGREAHTQLGVIGLVVVTLRQ